MGIIWENVKFAYCTCPIKMSLVTISTLIVIVFIGFWVLNKLPDGFNIGASVFTLGVLLGIMTWFAWRLDDDTCWIQGEEKKKLLADNGIYDIT